MNHRIKLMELDRCTNSQLLSSKFPEIRGSLACTCVARAQCTTTPKIVHHRIVLVELYQCKKFHVASSKFPESKGAYPYAYCTCCARALCTLSRNGMYHYALYHPITKWPYHEMACTFELRLLNSISVPNLVSRAQNFLEPEDPFEKTYPVLARAACNPQPR